MSVVACGSLARGELTSGSDADWLLLVDGAADPNHLDTVHAVQEAVEKCLPRAPGQERTFGSAVFSHDLVHLIGGEDDTNKNTTRRILLLLESFPIGRSDAYDRVINCVLKRYVLEDRTFSLRKSGTHVPRFLLNDIARYWRTMAVDFAYKARARRGKGFAVRNVKLRMSRKMIYVSGLLSCFGCELGYTQQGTSGSCSGQEHECVSCLKEFMCRPPLEILADVLLRLVHVTEHASVAAEAAREIMSAYDQFLGILADDGSRKRLEGLTADAAETDLTFKEARLASHRFRDGVLKLFFDVPPVARLTRVYGVF